jgi:site-specific recombinase XerC
MNACYTIWARLFLTDLEEVRQCTITTRNQRLAAVHALARFVGELVLAGSSVKIRGKGGKEIHCPLWPSTVAELTALIADRSPTAPVFLNRRGHPITRFGIHTLDERYVRKAQVQMPSPAIERIGPHTIRRTTATHGPPTSTRKSI